MEVNCLVSDTVISMEPLSHRTAETYFKVSGASLKIPHAKARTFMCTV